MNLKNYCLLGALAFLLCLAVGERCQFAPVSKAAETKSPELIDILDTFRLAEFQSGEIDFDTARENILERLINEVATSESSHSQVSRRIEIFGDISREGKRDVSYPPATTIRQALKSFTQKWDIAIFVIGSKLFLVDRDRCNEWIDQKVTIIHPEPKK